MKRRKKAKGVTVLLESEEKECRCEGKEDFSDLFFKEFGCCLAPAFPPAAPSSGVKYVMHLETSSFQCFHSSLVAMKVRFLQIACV